MRFHIAPDQRKPTGLKFKRINLALLLLLAPWVWMINLKHPRTNYAFVRANTVDIVIQHVNGRIQELNVQDNQPVKAGDILYVIDRRPYEAKVLKAEANLRLAEKTVSGQIADVHAVEAKIRQTQQDIQSVGADIKRLEAEATYAQSYLSRIEPLEAKAFVTHNAINEATAKRNATRAAVDQAKAKQQALFEQLESVQQNRATAEAQVARFGEDYARIQAAEAELRSAQLDLEYCTVKAEFDGYVTNLNTAVGQYVSPGEKLFALVDDRTWYVMAEFKETYLRNIQPGMPVDVYLAAYPGIHFKGVVQGIGWANAPDQVQTVNGLPDVKRSLNWVMLAARYQVRITLIERDEHHPFRMGMTAFTTVLGQ